MLKSKMQFLLCFIVFGIITGCASNYTVVKQTALTGNLAQYQEINVGWLNLGQEKYKIYGFEDKNKNDWKTILNDLNLKNFPEFLKDFIPGKVINTAKSVSESPKASGLVIKFTDVNYIQRTSSAAQILFGAMAGSDSLDVTVHFIDGRSGKELYSSSITVDSKAGTGYGSMGFEGRVTNTFYNLAYYISDKVK